MWWQEKSLKIDDRASAIEVLRNKNRNGRIVASIKLEDTEKKFILEDAQRLTERLALLEPVCDHTTQKACGIGEVFRNSFVKKDKSQNTHATCKRTFAANSQGEEIQGEVTISRRGTLSITPNRALTYIFSTFEPDHLGVIDFHAADRSYTYEQVSNVNNGVFS